MPKLTKRKDRFFAGTLPQFRKEIAKLCEKYGYYQYFFAVAEPFNSDSDNCTGGHGMIRESLMGYLEEMIEDLREKLDNEDEI